MKNVWQKILNFFKSKRLIKAASEEEKIRVRLHEINQKTRGSIMSWSKGHSSLTENPFNKPTIDRCINCGDHEEVLAIITMEFGEGNYNSVPIC